MKNPHQTVKAFLPCRRGSERVKDKNIRPFASIEGGLTRIKIEQLLACSEIDSVVVSTDDPKVVAICQKLAKEQAKPVEIFPRPEHLALSSTSTDALIEHIPEIITEGIVLWTHVTSPFVDAKVYSSAVQTFLKRYEDRQCDSLMSVTRLQKFLWNSSGPINYDRAVEKWPLTQTLEPLFEVNSAIFIAPIRIYRELHDRVGNSVYMYELDSDQALDIDWEKDFHHAEALWEWRKFQKVDSIIY